MLLSVIGFYAYFYMGVFFRNRSANAEPVFYTTEAGFFRNGCDTPIVIRGVELAPFVPGMSTWDLGASFDDYYRWMTQIAEMGANTLHITGIMNSAFYNAFFAFNTHSEHELFLLHGVYGRYYEDLTMYLRKVVDIIHGNRIDLFNRTGIQIFRRNISPWVIGFIVGTDWNPDSIAYINHNVNMPDSFEGQFFYTAEDANRFEVMLAQVMDATIAYETNRFGVQRPISFFSSRLTDFLEYDLVYATQLRKYAQLSLENIIPTEYTRAGVFASYEVAILSDNFLSYLSEVQLETLAPILYDLDTGCFFHGYLDLMRRYHTMPVVALGVSFSSGRIPTRYGEPALTEREQGQSLAMVATQIEERGWSGAVISQWQDAWERRTWNTAFAAYPWRIQYWHNLQSANANVGLVAFEPGREGRPVNIRPGAADWNEGHFVHEYDGIRIYAQYTFQGLYLRLAGSRVTPQSRLYIPIDVAPHSGTMEHEHLTFERPANFVLMVDGFHNTRLLTTMRSNASFMRFHEEVTGENPFAFIPGRWNSEFVPITLPTENTILVDELTAETLTLRRPVLVEVGRLTHGNNDPNSLNFNSLADFAFGEDSVVIRLPWLLLNFFDPSTMLVHDDYFVRFGVEGVSVNQIYVGIVGTQNTPISFSAIPLNPWRRSVEFHERLKESYFIIQQTWRR